ncbi:NAD(P)/FAD-dependent oxidoreductase [Flavobacterium subsaxonicum]|uniref:Pyridine nucleotide-disulfide oxidoreductase n=1 Tax=Flavobacterium subsaxonicum WB 4.1-42 = DSM 21790 TaxID=1121898 RepID=A0A0A2MLK1_9FLAO|nr:NAD(P)/FAD-dependent oxidoreductase [Flavobacterium subsaxonicum]KGO92476.1 pyridine nucleotide-disulfide oxidoreductase [Flavobacterium subsaxonicum WB 4.1-42 = DSM 21790]
MQTNYEVIIIGGSYAGLSAAMALGRASRNVLIIDANKPCNRQTPHSHNFLTQDGETPAAISAKAKEQVMAYPTVTFLNDSAVKAASAENGFSITTENGKTFTGKKLLLATGIKDIMPEIDGFAECWGISVIHCPYCHGYEVKNQPTAILANADAAMHYAQLLLQWTKDLTLFTNGPALFTNEQTAKLQKHNIAVIEGEVARLEQQKGQLESIALKNGSTHNFKVLYYKPSFEHHTNLHEQLHCAVNDMGFLAIDEWQKSEVYGVYAAGDCTTPMRSVAMAVAQGMKAGAMINNELASEAF